MWVPRYSLRAIRFWTAIVLWLEIGIFLAAGARCRWPDPGGSGKATHILLVADPQILDDRSYPERSSLLRTVSRIFVDMNLRKAWRVAKRKRPHAIIFLGDMMDSGFADMHIMEYQEYVGRFRSIFSAPPSVPVYYIPGNHDISVWAVAQHVVLGGHSLFMVDAPALVDEDLRRENTGEDRANGLPRDLGYLQHLRAENAANMPLILFTHIPLYRPPESNCGPLREKGNIPSYMGRATKLYSTQKPPNYSSTNSNLHSFSELTNTDSADDHDYCEYIHTSHDRQIPEVTIKSFSIAMGIANQVSSSCHSPATRTPMHINNAYCLIKCTYTVGSRAPITAPSYNQKHIPKRSKDLLPYPTLQQCEPCPHTGEVTD
ncbi:hypothetical protein BJV77DRAFT_961615 [Russula vinacea]|nr:hypothetical protein BJV77DRAFT_961615 [Russula vinacea]